MIGEIGCLLPWKAGNRTGRPCDTRQDLINFAEVQKRLNRDDEAWIIEMTGCLPQCTRFQYAKEHIYHSNEDAEDFSIGFTFFTSKYKALKQTQTLPLSTLVGNIGGYLGLLLGYSVLNALDWLSGLGAKIGARMDKK